ncbi:hypothetical protein [uncultured Phocaeicola sp.]|uniref:hypothetical protein n=1 Tax=uncultured Phocaeicola sp. TaxID=990718 RepID=UPI0025A21D3B|nr:hypothetical protein [uncultured Phocaeicola sp.]
MLATPQDRVAGCSFGGFFFYGALDKLPFCPGVFRPLSAALSRSLPGGGHGGVSHSDGHSVVRGKKEAGT